MNVVILTPIAVEFKYVRSHLSACKSTIVEGSLYETGRFKGRHHDYNVILNETGPKNTTAALAAEKAIRLFQPLVILLVGVAGGVRKVDIGDLVVGTMAYGYESGKETQNGPTARPHSISFSKDLIEIARMVGRSEEWRKRTADGAQASKVTFGPIASGDKVIATTDSPLYRYLMEHFNDTSAVEMEAIGFAQAVSPHRNLFALNIRGISDLLNNKSLSDKGGSQELASDRAAAFAMELLYQLDCNLLLSTQEEKKEAKDNDAIYKDVGIAQSGDGSSVNIEGKYVSGRDMIIKKR